MDNMKCLKSSKTGEIIRIKNEKADQATSEWKFIPKSEWKTATRRISVKTVEELRESVVDTISEKQLKRKK